jgi:hypothetical protein
VGKEHEIRSLELAGGGVTFTGTASISLESGEEWGFSGGVLKLGVTSGPIEFLKGITVREITFTNLGSLEITFRNGAVGVPGEITKGSFSLHELPENKCGEKLPADDSCAITVTSAKEGQTGEYKLEWGYGVTTLTTTRELKSS